MAAKSKTLDPARSAPRTGEAGSPLAASADDAMDAFAGRFDAPVRAGILKLMQSSSRAADLATVFPGAVYALACRHGTPARRRKALDLVERGAALKDVAAALELPLWLRRLPPEAFTGAIGDVPNSDLFARRIVNHLPIHASESAFWLAAVVFAAKACDDYFALWLASQPVFCEPGDPEHLFGLLAAYAWYSNAEVSRAHGLIGVPWRPEMAFDTAVCAAKSWLNRLRLVLQLQRGAVTDPWLEPGEACGLKFEPLIDQADILSEAHAMRNCADQYADRVARDRCRLFSVRRRGVRIATLEIGPHPREAGVLAINQLKARHNMPATNEIWQAAHAWLGHQKQLRRSAPLTPPERPLDAPSWDALMLAYRNRMNGAPWIPEPASQATFAGLEHDIAELARRCGITSWLFT